MSVLKKHFIKSFADELANLNGTEFEYLCKPLLSIILKEEVAHKGHNLYGKPVGYTGDFIADNYKVVGQCGTEPDYFHEFAKPIKDINRAIANHANCETVYLFANQRGTGGGLTALDDEIKNRKFDKIIEVYDSERCANTVLDNINATTKIEEILEFLSKTKEQYKLLPQTNKLPSFKSHYYEREDEKKVLNILENQDYVQIYGISGIGKTELSISIANHLKDDFDTIIWLDGDLLERNGINFSSVHINRFNSSINLAFLLQRHKTCLIVDNLNQHVNNFVASFSENNCLGSKCIISSLQRNVASNQSYRLGFLHIDIARRILLSCQPQPSEEIVNNILENVQGYPLVLKLIKSAVEIDDFSWGDIVNEIDSLKDFTDDRNKKLSDRIIGGFLRTIGKELTLLHFLDNRTLSRPFIAYTLGQVGVNALEKRSLITVQDSYYFNTHQLILESIKQNTNVEDHQVLYEGKLCNYLKEYNEIKSIDYFKFLLNHKGFLERIYSRLPEENDLKKVILYAFIQSTDYFSQPKWIISELEKFKLSPSQNYQDLLLYIEQQEIQLFQLKPNNEEYTKTCERITTSLEKFQVAVNDDYSKSVLLHHMGKFYLKKGDSENAEKYFNQVLAYDKEADYCLLQLARIDIQNKKFDDAARKIDVVLGGKIDLGKQSLAILLSFYELIANQRFSALRKKYIDSQPDFFLKVLLSSIDKNFDQPYHVLNKLSSHLAYLVKDVYQAICEVLPLPSNLEASDKLKFAYANIYFAYFKLLKYSKEDVIENRESKMKDAFCVSEQYFLSASLENDYQRKRLLDLYIQAEAVEKAQKSLEAFDNMQDVFFLQNKCKVYRMAKDFPKALETIEQALEQNEVTPTHKAAFLNDKAETLKDMKNQECLSILDVAISLQPDRMTKEHWEDKKKKWIEELK